MLKNVVLVAVFVLGLTSDLLGGVKPKTVTITDYIGVDWNHELVHYQLDFAKGQLTGGAVAKVNKGNSELPCQISNVKRYDIDGSIESFKVWFFADIPANKSVSYTISPGVKGVSVKGVEVQPSAGSVILTTNAPGKIGIKLMTGKKEYNWPEPAGNVPGPIQGLILPSGQTAGKGMLDVPFLVKSYKSEIRSTGPLFTEVRLHYVFDTGYWTFTAKVINQCPMIVIQEEFNTGFSKQSFRDFNRFYSLNLNTGGFKAENAFFGGRCSDANFNKLLANGTHEDWKKILPSLRSNWFASPVNGFPLSYAKDQRFYSLLGYPTVIAQLGCLVRLNGTGDDAIGFAALNTMNWKDPMGIQFRETKSSKLLVDFPLQVYKQEWALDGFRDGSPNYTGKTLFAAKYTSRRNYGIMLTKKQDEKKHMLKSLFEMAAKLGARPLDVVKDWQFDWKSNKDSAKFASKSDPATEKALDILRRRVAFKRAVGNFGRFSMAYHYGFAKGEYPTVKKAMDHPEKMTKAQYEEMKNLCTWLAYDMHSLDTFPWGSGFHLNNPNMSIMAVEARTKAALLVKEHPLFKEWGQWDLAFLKDYIRRFTRESGAPYENPHYTLGVTLSWMAIANDVLLESGIGDAFDTPLFKKCMEFCFYWLTPPDPRYFNHRVVFPLGNCSYQSVPPEFGTHFIEYYKKRDPELAEKIQWFVNQTLPEKKKIKIVSKETVPQLKSTHHQDYGVTFLHGFGTPYETHFLMYAGNCDGHYEWETDQMSYSLYAKGQPINLHFGNGYFPMFCRPWLRNKVSIDHKVEQSERNVTQVLETSFSPGVDYLRASRDIDRIRPYNSEYPDLDAKGHWTAKESANMPLFPVWTEIPMMTWFRQVMFLKEPDPKGPNYFVFRETFGGKPTKPTDLTFWFLANKMKKVGGIFHYDGQLGTDMDVFVVTPEKPEIETGKYGHINQPYRRLTGDNLKCYPNGKRREDQLFLRLKQPPEKGYMVVLYPRLKQNDPPAKFARLAKSVVKVETVYSTDYVLMNSYPFSYKDKDIDFRGMATAIRHLADGKLQVVNNEGELELKLAGKIINGKGAFTVTLDKGKIKTNKQTPDAIVSVK